MTTEYVLREKFPMLRTREEVLKDIQANTELKNVYDSWLETEQKDFLDMCTGAKGVKMIYDSFFKEIMNAEYVPERLSDFLSAILHQKVKVLHALVNDGVRLGGESSLIYTDLVVELEDGSIANIEIQKIGYLFPGQRAACYSSDLLLRQYKRVRDECEKKKQKFSYSSVMPVYTIVLFECSPKEFKAFPNEYMHYFGQQSNTGLELDLLQKFLFIPLDIFRKIIHTKDSIDNKLEAWLYFLSTDEPKEILRLLQAYPEFQKLYEEIYQLCMNTEKVMGMFSEELRILDHNTAEYMVDVMKNEIDELRDEAYKLMDANKVLKNANSELQDANSELQDENSNLRNEIEQLKKQLQLTQSQ